MAPTAGLEPATSKLTASCSTIELRRNTNAIIPLPLSLVNASLARARPHYALATKASPSQCPPAGA